jgi:hypothetical protein
MRSEPEFLKFMTEDELLAIIYGFYYFLQIDLKPGWRFPLEE